MFRLKASNLNLDLLKKNKSQTCNINNQQFPYAPKKASKKSHMMSLDVLFLGNYSSYCHNSDKLSLLHTD